jgi:hypothetical protein
MDPRIREDDKKKSWDDRKKMLADQDNNELHVYSPEVSALS